jgi:acyl carrier protein
MKIKENKVNEIINEMRAAKGLSKLEIFNESQDLRNDLGFDSFDLAELTVRIEDVTGIDIFSNGIISTVGQVYSKVNEK